MCAVALDAHSFLLAAENADGMRREIERQAGAWLSRGAPEFALVFLSSRFGPDFEPWVWAVAESCRPKALAGCTGFGVLGTGREVENAKAASVLLLRAPGLKIRLHHLTQESLEESTGPGFWFMETGVPQDEPRGIIVLADPFSVAAELLVKQVGEAYAGVPVIGGLASTHPMEQRTCLFEGHAVRDRGALLAFLEGPVRLETVVAQGCRPIGEPMVVTGCDGHLIHRIGSRPALKVLSETLETLTADERKRALHKLHLGVAVNEYVEDFHRGDFLVRNLLGAEQDTGTLVVDASLRPGQTVQFQVRDAASATEDLDLSFERARQRAGKSPVRAAVMFSCAGRGPRLFGREHHDPEALERRFGSCPLTGFMCNGEIGPVGERVFLHGYTCASGLLMDADPSNR